MEALRLILSAFLALGVASSTAWAVNFETNPGDPGNMVTFKIAASLETGVGTSAAVKGNFKFNPRDVKASSTGKTPRSR